MLEFEWDEDKAKTNLAKHSVGFGDAIHIFDDAFALHFTDRSMNHDEERFIGIWIVNGLILTVVYTERGDCIRLISARKATRHEQKTNDEARQG